MSRSYQLAFIIFFFVHISKNQMFTVFSWVCRPKPLRSSSSRPRLSQARPRPSSSQEAAGRAGRVRQSAQEKPRLVPPLPPPGPGDREARGSPRGAATSARPSPARGDSGPAAQRPARCCGRRRRGEAGAIALGEGEGGESSHGRARKLRRAAELGRGGANRLSRQAATPPTATGGAAETGRPAARTQSAGAPGGLTCRPGPAGQRGPRLVSLFFPRLSDSPSVPAAPGSRAPWRTQPRATRLAAHPASSCPRPPGRASELRPYLPSPGLPPAPSCPPFGLVSLLVRGSARRVEKRLLSVRRGRAPAVLRKQTSRHNPEK